VNPAIEWRRAGGRRCLVLKFVGQFSEHDAREAVDAVESMIDENQGGLTMVWDCTEMGGYDTAAREIWQSYMARLKPNLDVVNLVSKSIMIRTGAMIVGTFAGIKIATWTSFEDFESRS
jgi:hypothetical protein